MAWEETTARRIAIVSLVPCPRCGAGEGRGCVGAREAPRIGPHRERVVAARSHVQG
jgi:hypothetical protein